METFNIVPPALWTLSPKVGEQFDGVSCVDTRTGKPMPVSPPVGDPWAWFPFPAQMLARDGDGSYADFGNGVSWWSDCPGRLVCADDRGWQTHFRERAGRLIHLRRELPQRCDGVMTSCDARTWGG